MLFLFFFFKQKTAYEMRISDWSSDVCSSDLHDHFGARRELQPHIECACGQLIAEAQQADDHVDHQFAVRGNADDDAIERAAESVAAAQQRDLETARAIPEERRVGTEWVSTGRSRW